MKSLALLALLLGVGCSGPTELLLVIKADSSLKIGAGGDIDTLRVQVQPSNDPPTTFYFTKLVDLCAAADAPMPDCRPQRYASPDYDGKLSLPLRLLLTPGSDGLDGNVRVWVDGLQAGGSKPRLSSGLTFHFSAHHRLWIELPLYTECLDDLVCQAQDLVCGIDRQCTSATATTSEPNDDAGTSDDLSHADLAGTDGSGADLSSADLSHRDFSIVCGHAGEECCPVDAGPAQCDPGFTCDPASNSCAVTGATCGTSNMPCCPTAPACNGSSLTCAGGKCAVVCGGENQVCCNNGAPHCNASPMPNTYALSCSGGNCVRCGGAGDPCCDTSDGQAACLTGGTCVAGMPFRPAPFGGAASSANAGGGQHCAAATAP